MPKEIPFEETGLSKPQTSEDIKRSTEEKTLEYVFAQHLLAESDSREIPRHRKREFTNKKVPIYFDALYKGQPVIEEKIDKGELKFEVLDGTGFKQYFYDDDANLHWKIVAKSEDPFEALAFLKQARATNIPLQGDITLFSDHILINKMLEEGFDQHERLFDNFTRAKSLTQFVKLDNSPATHIPSYKQALKSVNTVYNSIFRKGKPVDERYDEYISKYVIPKDDVIEDAERILTLHEDISKITNLYTYNDEKPFSTVQDRVPLRPFEDTLLIQLLTHPAPINNYFKYYSKISVKDLAQVLNFAKSILNSSTPERQPVIAAMVAHSTVNTLKSQIDQLSTEKDINPKIMTEYFESLIADNLLNMPGIDFTSPDSADSIRHQTILNSHYYLTKNIQASPTIQKHRNNINEKWAAIYRGKEKLSLKYLSGLPENEQTDFLLGLLRYRPSFGESPFILIGMRKILKDFYIEYNPSEKRFLLPAKQVEKLLRENIDLNWVRQKTRIVLAAAIDLTERGNPLTPSEFEKIITDAALPEFLKERRYPTNHRRFYYKTREIYFDWVEHQKDAEYARTLRGPIYDQMAGFLLFQQKEDIFNNNDEAQKLIFNMLLNMVDASDILLNNQEKSQKHQLFPSRIHDSVTKRSRQLMQEFKIDHFGEAYSRNRVGAVVKRVKASIKELSIDKDDQTGV